MLHFPIFLADCDYRGAMQFDTFCQSKKWQVFIQSYKLLLLQRLLKIFDHAQYGLTHIVLSKKKKDQTAFEWRCTSQKFYPGTIRFKSYSPLKYLLQVST